MSTRIAADFVKYHADNPHVWELFVRYAKQMISSGRTRYSSYSLLGVIRWHMDVETVGDPFKINNNYGPYYARLFMQTFPEHGSFFRLRELAP